MLPGIYKGSTLKGKGKWPAVYAGREKSAHTHFTTSPEEVFCGFLVHCSWRRSKAGGA